MHFSKGYICNAKITAHASVEHLIQLRKFRINFAKFHEQYCQRRMILLQIRMLIKSHRKSKRNDKLNRAQPFCCRFNEQKINHI